jgi:hypothetical protein
MSNPNQVVYTNEVIKANIAEAMKGLEFKVNNKVITIPESLCDKRRKPTVAQIEAGRPSDDYYVSAEYLLNKLDQRDGLVESQHSIDQREKAHRVELYRSQLESGQVLTDENPTFDYLSK